MKLEQQVCNLELAQRLKELGVKQDDSLFHYAHKGELRSAESLKASWNNDNRDRTTETTTWSHWLSQVNGSHIYAAFTVAELGNILPFRSKKMSTINDALLVCRKTWSGSDSAWMVFYEDEDSGAAVTPRFIDGNEANARAEMLIYLLENQLIKCYD